MGDADDGDGSSGCVGRDAVEERRDVGGPATSVPQPLAQGSRVSIVFKQYY